MKKTKYILATIGTVALLAACGNKTDANEKNFGAAMTQYFEKRGDLCLNTRNWPVDVSEMDLRLQKTTQTGTAGQMAALEAVGLVKSEDAAVEVKGFFGKPTGSKINVKRYTLTELAKPFAQEKNVDSIGLNGKTTEKQIDLCWGKKALDKIVKWEGPMKLGEYQEAGVTYTYKVNNAAEWTKKPEIQAAFPIVKTILDGASSKESRHGIKLTSQGWEAKGLD
ncbi:hypothetical protein [Comamonas testosteroni]|uniref:hypothetical protein n=1 Tax=Comamonas testosteroni TaxID=285 RepID=UPI002E101867|nr:hypothetical protein U0024_26950 [Comamonas testosteroni]